jgi:hypothetical protein
MGQSNAIVAQDRVGTHANAWDNAASGAGGFSNILDTEGCSIVSGFGHVSGTTTLTLQVSQNGADFYDNNGQEAITGAVDFGTSWTVAARYVRLKSSNNVTITATLAARG